MKRKVLIGLLFIALVMSLALPAQAMTTTDRPSSAEVEYSPGQEIISERGRAHRVYYVDETTRQAVFVGSPEFTKSSVDGSWVEYGFTDYGDYYTVQHPWSSVAFHDYYTVVYDETFTEVKVYDDRWIVEYLNKQGNWTDSSFWNVTRSYEIVSDGIKLKRTGNTDIGQREEIYYFRNGSPCKITINQTCDEAQNIRFVWKPSGIVAASERHIKKDFDDPTSRTTGLNYYDSTGKFVETIRWYDALAITDNIDIVAEASAGGRKATVTFGGFAIDAGGIACLDPETFYPDEGVASVDGYVGHNEDNTAWATIQGDEGTIASDTDDWGHASIRAGSATLWRNIYRGVFLFDCSGLPDDALITAATQSLYGNTDVPISDDLGINEAYGIYASAPASDTSLVAGDYDSLGTTKFSDTTFAVGTWDDEGYNDFPYNAVGIAAIPVDDLHKSGFREVNYDVTGDEPEAGAGSGASCYAYAYSCEKGAGYKPKLVVTYTVGPTIITNAASSVEETSASLSGNVTSVNDTNITQRGFVWDTSTHIDPGNTAPPATYSDNWTESGSWGVGEFTHNIDSLTKGDLYYVRACALNDFPSWAYGDEVTFFTKPDAPYNLAATVTGSGNITLTWNAGEGADTTIVRAKIGSYPTNYDTDIAVYNGALETVIHSGLTGGTTYYYRAWCYATEAGSEAYSDDSDEAFRMALTFPLVTTNTAQDVGSTKATLQGNITSTGGATPNFRGFVWDTTSRGDPGNTAPADSAYPNYTTESDSFGTGTFTHLLTTLTGGQTYYYRACAHNSMGWSYGTQVTFATIGLALWFEFSEGLTSTTIPDQAGNNDGLASFRTTSSDADVSAELISFQPIAEAKAPDYVLGEAPAFIDPGITGNVTGTFTTTPGAGAFPLAGVITAIAEATKTPAQLPLLIIAVFCILAASLSVSATMRRYGSGSLIVKILVIAAVMGIFVALGNFAIDFWMIVVFLVIAVALAFASKQLGWS